MRAQSEADLLGLWESGLYRSSIDRGLLMCARARPDLRAERFASLPLGVVNAALLQMRELLFGPRIELQVGCPQCAEQLAVGLEIGQLLADAEEGDGRCEVDVGGCRFRVPDSRDLASIANAQDVEAAALRILERCCVERPCGMQSLAAILDDAESALEAADSLADLRLAVSCGACGHGWEAGVDPGALLWDEVQRHARGLLGEVHALASAYGWTESEVLALSAQRRSAYLEMAGV